MTFDDLKTLLFARSNFGMKLGLDRMRAALKLLGDPHTSAPVLHVAGTNGKGSTCAFTESALRVAGLNTGLTTSPHLVHWCERIRIDGVPLSEQAAADTLAEILARVPWALQGGPEGAHDGDGLTFFELTTLIAFLSFAKAQVQVMVVEVGLGGRLDATNVVEPIACAVAPLGLEHTQYLGPTLTHIAGEKAGIFKPGVTAVSAGQPLEAARVLAERAREVGAPLWRPGRDYRFESRHDRPFCFAGKSDLPVCGEWTVKLDAPLPLLGHHQRTNAALACALLQAGAARGLPIEPKHVEQGLLRARWPGRLEKLSDKPLTLLDGAHNPHAAHALAKTLPEVVGDRPVQLVLGVLADKDARQILEPLLPLVHTLHTCAPDNPRALEAEALAAVARTLRPELPIVVHKRAQEALAAARAQAGAGGAVLAAGSLYLVGELEPGQRVKMPTEKL